MFHEQTRYMNGELWPIIKHFSTSFNIPINQSVVEFPPFMFQGPIANITPPVKHVTCLTSGTSWKTEHVAGVHWSGLCKASANSTLLLSDKCSWHNTHFWSVNWRIGWVLMLSFPNGVQLGDTHALTTPGQSASPAEHYVVSKGLEADSPPWIRTLGWPTWPDKRVQVGLFLETLQSFTALPP